MLGQLSINARSQEFDAAAEPMYLQPGDLPQLHFVLRQSLEFFLLVLAPIGEHLGNEFVEIVLTDADGSIRLLDLVLDVLRKVQSNVRERALQQDAVLMTEPIVRVRGAEKFLAGVDR